MATHQEKILRYRILRHEELPERHKEAYRAEGIDPDDMWSLIWSFGTKEAAEQCLADEQFDAPAHWKFKLVDAGVEVEYIERQIW